MVNKLIKDPTGRNKGVDSATFYSPVPLMHWALAWRGEGSLRDFMESAYQMPIYEMNGGELLSDGTYTYPGDPDLPPLWKLETGDSVVYFYEYAMLNIDGYMTRMD